MTFLAVGYRCRARPLLSSYEAIPPLPARGAYPWQGQIPFSTPPKQKTDLMRSVFSGFWWRRGDNRFLHWTCCRCLSFDDYLSGWISMPCSSAVVFLRSKILRYLRAERTPGVLIPILRLFPPKQKTDLTRSVFSGFWWRRGDSNPCPKI